MYLSKLRRLSVLMLTLPKKKPEKPYHWQPVTPYSHFCGKRRTCLTVNIHPSLAFLLPGGVDMLQRQKITGKWFGH